MTKVSEIVSSYPTYLEFMKGEKTLEQLDKVFQNSDNKYSEESGRFNLFVRISKSVANVFLSFVADNFDRFAEEVIKLKNSISLRDKLLVHSKNKVEKSFSLALKNIDPKLKNFLINSQKNNKKIYFNQGLCRGMSEWFVYLYQKTKNRYKQLHPEFHLRKIAEVFENGAPIEAGFLQKFSNSTSFRRYFNEVKYCLSIFDPLGKKQRLQRIFNDLPFGIYLMIIFEKRKNNHAIVLIRESKKCVYIWDPNIGLIKEKNKNFEESILERCEEISREIGCNSQSQLLWELRLIDDITKKYESICIEKEPEVFVFQDPKTMSLLCRIKNIYFRKIEIFIIGLITIPLFPYYCIRAIYRGKNISEIRISDIAKAIVQNLSYYTSFFSACKYYDQLSALL